MSNHKDSWKNKKVFEEQLKLNKRELDNNYPFHWHVMLDFISGIIKSGAEINSILDVGCGCGAVSKLIERHFPNIKYTGTDYSLEAVTKASKEWPFANFIKKDYKDLTENYIEQFDVVYACSLHNVLSNGDEAIDYVLSLKPKFLILSKIIITNKESYYETYTAYDLITTYLFYHNYPKLMQKLKKNYHVVEVKEDHSYYFLLRRNDV